MSGKISFKCDYSQLSHPRILEALGRPALELCGTYGQGEYCREAAQMIRDLAGAGAKNADIHFVCGGTQANLVSLSHILRPWQSVISCDSGHIIGFEAGAIEACGHRISMVPNRHGKLGTEDMENVLAFHNCEHTVIPGAVYISQSTELGTVYSAEELQAISGFCRRNGLYLFMDGARIGNALGAKGNDLDLARIASLVDMFYIGGTKNGALFGEAVVIINDSLKRNFRNSMKRHGALLAKGDALGLQFSELFRDGLYLELAAHANKMAEIIADSISEAGYSFKAPPQTNMIFPVFPESTVEELEKNFDFIRWDREDDGKIALRLVTSWATRLEEAEEFGRVLRRLQDHEA